MRFKKIKIISLNETAARFMTSGSLNIMGVGCVHFQTCASGHTRVKITREEREREQFLFIRKSRILSEQELVEGVRVPISIQISIFFSPLNTR